MEFMQRNGRSQAPIRPAAPGEPAAMSPASESKSKRLRESKVFRIGTFVIMFLLTGLLIAFTALVMFAKGGESELVKKDRLQAVFLNGGQVYFGKISSLNRSHLTLANIYYLRVNQQVQPNQEQTTDASNDVTLAKLGCELHGPEDLMVINREQVMFWENLKADGQVAEAVKRYVEQNPDGQKCDAPSSTSTGTTGNDQ